MANSGFYKPEGYNPYDDVLEGKRSDGEADWGDNKPAKRDSDEVANSRNMLRDAENSALSGGFYQGGNDNDNKKNNKNKLNGLGNKKGLTVVGLILILVVGFGIFLGSTHSLLGPALSAKSLEQLDSMNAAQEIEMANTLACLSSGECEGELSEDIIEALESNGIEVGDDHKSLYYNGENISGDRLPEIMDENVAVRSAVTGATLGQIANVLDETAINIDNNRGISKNMFVDYEMTNNIETDLKNYEEIVNNKIGGQISTNTYTEHEDVQYKTKGVDKNGDGDTEDDGEWCYIDKHNNCTDDSDEYVMKEHTTSSNSSVNATTTASTKQEATDSANGYIANISTSVTQISSWGCTSLRLGQLLAAQQASNEKIQSLQTYSSVMEPISKMMDGHGTYSPYHALMTKLIEEKTIDVADYANASISGGSAEDTTVDIANIPITGSAITAPSVQSLLTDTAFSTTSSANYSYERTNTVLNNALSPHGFTVERCNADQHADEDYDGNGKRLHSNKNNLVAELITRATSITVSMSRGSGKTQSSGGLAWTGTRKFMDNVLGKFVKKFFVNVDISGFIQFMGPAFGEASYANAGIVYEGVELGEAVVRGGSAYFSDMGAMGSGQTGADSAVIAEYNKATKAVLAKQAEVDRYNRSPFDVTSPNTFFGSIAYSFLPLATNKNVTGLSSLVRNTGSSLSSLMGVASAATETTYYSADGDCDRFVLRRYNGTTIEMGGDPYCNRKTVTDPSVLGKPHSDPEYSKFVADNVENNEVKENGELAEFMSYCAFRLSPPGILDAGISEEVDEKKTPLRRFIQFISSIFGFLNANYDDEESGWVDYYSCVLSEDNPKYESVKQASVWMLRQRQLIQVGAVKYDDSPMIGYAKKYWETHAPTDYTDYIAKTSGMSYDDAQLVLNTIAYYTFVDQYDSTERIAMDEHPTDSQTSEQVIAKIQDEDLRIDDGEKNEPIILIDQQITYADVRNRSHTV